MTLLLLHLAVFLAVALVEVGWCYSVAAVRTGSPLQAALLAGGLTLLVSGTTVLYTDRRWLLVPTILGAMAGAYVAVWRMRRRERKERDHLSMRWDPPEREDLAMDPAKPAQSSRAGR